MAHYSSLFTFGLLSDRDCPSPLPSPDSNSFYQFRKSSLPTSALSKPSDIPAPSEGLRSRPQFTNPFASSPEATTELRSFLSLDLAADQSWSTYRPNKLLSPLDSDMAPTCPPCTVNAPPRQRIPSASSHLPVHTSPSSVPPVRRPSRDSLRTLPSPRPAPSSALPQVPCERKEPHPLPPIFIPSPSLFPPRSAGGISPTSVHGPLSAPPAAPFSAGTSSSFVQTPPISPLSSPNYRGSRQGSFMSFSASATSIRTARRRNMERSNALACLEGRSRMPGRVPRKVRQRNFMSMSDDEDEVAGDDEDAGGDADVEDDSDAPERLPQATLSSSLASPASAPISSTTTVSSTEFHSPIDEEEDRVLPAVAIPSPIQAASQKPRSRSRRSTLESWFPLANFIDLKDDELQGWRGVVEIVNGL